MFSIKIHKSQGEVILACCDIELVGKEFETEEHLLSITPQFYGDESFDENDVLEKVPHATMINFMGERVCKMACDNGIIPEKNIQRVCGIDHAQLYVL